MSDTPFSTALDDRAGDARESVRLVLGASAVSLLLWFVPFVGLALYPIRLFVTYVHEICHALAAVATLGSVLEIELFWDTSGLTYTSGGLQAVISSAGYVGTPLVGAALLLLSARRRTVRPALLASGAALAVAALWLGGNPLAWVGGLGLGAALAVVGLKAGPRSARFALSFLAIQCILNALSDLKFLLWLSATSPAATDAQNMAQATYGVVPAAVWTLLWTAVALVILAVAVHNYYTLTMRRAPRRGQPI